MNKLKELTKTIIKTGYDSLYCRIGKVIPFIFLCCIMNFFICSSVNSLEKNAIYYNSKGWECLKRGDNFKAILNFKNALKKNTKFKEAIVGLGNAYLNNEAYEASLQLFNDALKIDNNDSEAIIGIGFIMIALGKYKDAMKYFDLALKISEENVEPKYGIAYLYYSMDRIIWAKRQIREIFTINPYHYKSLLLMADIKIGENRFNEAKEYVQKAIQANGELPDGYIKHGQVQLSNYQRTYNKNYLDEAVEEFNKAIAIHQENVLANRCMGLVSIFKKEYNEAVKFYQKSLSTFPDNGISLYNLAVAYNKGGNVDSSLKYFLKTLEFLPSDGILQSRLEDFLRVNNYRAGHPLRVRLSNEHYEKALDKQKENFSDEVILHLRRSILLNPMNRVSRENLMDNYLLRNFNRFYIKELKDLLKIYQEDKYNDMLRVAIIKRRNRLYNKEGYSIKIPPRDVPWVFVLDLWPRELMTIHVDAGEVLANYLTFCMAQFGRLRPVGVKRRLDISKNLGTGEKLLRENLEKLAQMVKKGEINRLDYVIYGSFHERHNYISAKFELLDFHKGIVISDFTLAERGKDSLVKLSLRASKKIYNTIPYRGRVLKVDRERMIINLGLFDGVKLGDLFFIEKLESPENRKKLIHKKKIILTVNDSDTLISSVSSSENHNIRFVDINDKVYPLKKRRSRLIK